MSLSATRGEAFDGRAVEPLAVGDAILQFVAGDGDALDDAGDVHELEVDIAHALALHLREHLLC